MFATQLFTCSEYGEREGRVKFALQDADSIYISLGNDSAASEKLREDILDTVIDTLRVLRYFVSSCHMMQTAIRMENIFRKRNGETETQQYWKGSIRRSLQNVMYILKPGTGVLARYVVAAGCVARVNAGPCSFSDVCEELYPFCYHECVGKNSLRQSWTSVLYRSILWCTQ